MVALTYCAGCTTGKHDDHIYWIQKPPEGVMGGFACRCSGPDECAGNGEKLLRSLFGDDPFAPVTAPTPAGQARADRGEAERFVIVGDWLAVDVGRHTCGTGQDGHYGAHEPGCGLEPVVTLAELARILAPASEDLVERVAVAMYEADQAWEAEADPDYHQPVEWRYNFAHQDDYRRRAAAAVEVLRGETR